MTNPIPPEAMTLIMGLGAPEQPGMHGPMKMPKVDQPALDLAINIRDMCDQFIKQYGEEGESDELQESGSERDQGQEGQEEDPGQTDRRGDAR